ncbi:hypothetical protein KQ876_03415, partial [Mycoplasma sp. CSL7491-lung]
NKSYICSTGQKTRFINIDIDSKAEILYKTLTNFYKKVIKFEELNNKRRSDMLFLKYFLPSFWYETNSSNENNKKIRLVYAFDSNINVDVAKNIAQKLITILEYVFLTSVDKASKNIKQIFYGTKNNVFVNTNLRIYNSTKALEILQLLFKKFNLNEDYEESKKSKNIKYDLIGVIKSDDYEEALWIFIALSKINLQYLLKTKPKWIKKFEDTIQRRPYFQPKNGSKGQKLLAYSSTTKTKE